MGIVQTRVNYWLQVLLCHLDCFGDNGSPALWLFFHLMEVDCAWFFVPNRILSNIFRGKILSSKNMKSGFSENTSHNRGPIVRNSVSTVRVPDKLHSGGALREIPIATNLPLISCWLSRKVKSELWTLKHSGYLDGAIPWGRHYIFVVKVDHVHSGPVPYEDTA